MAQGFAREFGPQGIHVAHVVIDGVLDDDYARSKYPAFTNAKGENGLINIDEAAQSYWFLHTRPAPPGRTSLISGLSKSRFKRLLKMLGCRAGRQR